MSLSVKDRICPLCGEDNNCQHNKECWCVDIEVPKYIIEMIPEDKRGMACICKPCIEKYS